MALIRWQPFQETTNLRRQMERMFDEMSTVDGETQVNWRPAIELQDTEENVILRAQVPGVEAKDLDVRVTREAVVISGEHRYEKKEQQRGYFRSEFRYGNFQRVVPLPVHVQNDRVQADFKDGILTLTLPKVTEVRNRVVKLNLAENTNAAPAIADAAPAVTDAPVAEANNTEATKPAELTSVWD